MDTRGFRFTPEATASLLLSPIAVLASCKRCARYYGPDSPSWSSFQTSICWLKCFGKVFRATAPTEDAASKAAPQRPSSSTPLSMCVCPTSACYSGRLVAATSQTAPSVMINCPCCGEPISPSPLAWALDDCPESG